MIRFFIRTDIHESSGPLGVVDLLCAPGKFTPYPCNLSSTPQTIKNTNFIIFILRTFFIHFTLNNFIITHSYPDSGGGTTGAKGGRGPPHFLQKKFPTCNILWFSMLFHQSQQCGPPQYYMSSGPSLLTCTEKAF